MYSDGYVTIPDFISSIWFKTDKEVKFFSLHHRLFPFPKTLVYTE